jgi:lipopolysaccharide export system protein LptC
MKNTPTWRIARAAGGACLALALAACGGSDSKPANARTDAASSYIEKFDFPERDENGVLKWKVSGDRARIRPDGVLDIVNARAEVYASNKVDVVFTTPACLLDRTSNRVTTDAPVRIERSNMIVTGVGGVWDGKAATLNIRSNVQVVVKNGLGIMEQQNKLR